MLPEESKRNDDPPSPLRLKAEAALRPRHQDVSRMSPAEIQKLIYELEVHQVELEMQNEELRETQIAMARSRDRFVDLYDFAPVGYVTVDPEGIIVEANLTFSLMLGTERCSLTGRKITRCITRGAQDLFYFHLRSAIETGRKQVCELVLLRAGGTTFHARMETIRIEDPDTGAIHFRSAILDISARKIAELELEQSHAELERRVAERTRELAGANRELKASQEEIVRSAAQLSRLAAIVESSADAIIGANRDGLIQSWNAGAEYLMGYTCEDVLGKPLNGLIASEYLIEYRKACELVGSGTTPELFEIMVKHRDGRLIDVSIRLSAIRMDNGTIIGQSLIARDISLRKRAEAALRESEVRYRMLFNTLIEGFCIIEMVFDGEGNPVDYRFLETNPAFERQTGLHDAPNHLITEILPNNETKWYRIYGRIAQTGKPERFVSEAKALGRWYEISAFRFGGEDSRKVAILFNDITEAKLAETALQQSEAQLHSFVLQAPAALAMFDRRMTCLAASRYWTQLYGGGHDNPAGLHYDEIYPGQPEQWKEAQQKALAGESLSCEEDLWMRRDGSKMWLRWAVRPWLDARGHTGGILMMLEDITARKLAEEKLQKAMVEVTHIRSALDHHAIVAVTDAQGYITYVNDLFCEVSGYPREALIGKTHQIVNSGRHPKAFFASMWETISSGKIWRGEIENRKRDGSPYFVATTIVPRLGADGKPEQYIAVRTDVTEQNRVSESLRRLSRELEIKNSDLETLIRAASHDLRSPLVNVQGFASVIGELSDRAANLLREAAAGRPPAREDADAVALELTNAVRFVTAGVQKMDGLLKSLLIFSRLGRTAPVLQTVDAEAVLRECLAAIQFQLAAAGSKVTSGPLPPCQADPELLSQVFSNLIDNSIKYRHPERPMTLSISGALEGDRCVYRFTDNGIGIAPEHQELVFQLFHRLDARHGEGHGLGLAIARRALDLMGGSISVAMIPEGGTEFVISLVPPPRGTQLNEGQLGPFRKWSVRSPRKS